MSRPRRRIGIVGPYGWLGTVPSLLGLIQSLSEHGYGVDIYACQDNAFPSPAFPDRDVRIFILPQMQHQGRTGWRWRFLTQWVPYLTQQLGRKRYGCLIGIDPWGLVLASIPAKFHRIPVVYLSLELYFWDELTSPWLRLLKLLERKCNQRAVFTIIQDEDRARLLMAENGISGQRVEFLPNAPPGEARLERTDYLRRTLGIADERTIVLNLGSIHPATQSVELAQQARRWNIDAVLVFHTRSLLADKYATALRSLIDGCRVYLSAEPIDISLVPVLVASADVGVALYTASEQKKNVFTLGLSSGKIAHYLQCGLPVVATGLPSVRRYIEGYDCGICVEQVEEVGSAVKVILGEYARYSGNALTCFKGEFDLDTRLKPILQRLSGLIA
jgi:glycosyltransferase involved in cell wall biosynthesis